LPVKLNETCHVVPLPLSLTDIARPVTFPLPSAENIPTRRMSCRPVALFVLLVPVLLVVLVVPVLVELVPPGIPVLPAMPARLVAGCMWNEYEPCKAPLNAALFVVVVEVAPPKGLVNCAWAIVLSDTTAIIRAVIASTLLVTLSAIWFLLSHWKFAGDHRIR
jgi:hypothetical protein